MHSLHCAAVNGEDSKLGVPLRRTEKSMETEISFLYCHFTLVKCQQIIKHVKRT